MKITFSPKSIEDISNEYVRVRLVAEGKGVRRFVREEGGEWIEIGIGKPADITLRSYIILCRSLIRTARQHKIRKLAVQFDRTPEVFEKLQDFSSEELFSLAAQNFVMANFEFTAFKSKKENVDVQEVLLCGKSDKAVQAAVKEGQLIGESVNATRVLANTPGGDMTPKLLAKAAKQVATGLPVTVQVLGRTQMEKLGMGAILAVSKGSSEEPQFIVMEYKGAAGKPIVLAGKGITFDSGGLNLKPGDGHEMHLDMSGGAAVIQTVALAAKLGLKKHVIGLVPASENMPGNNALRPHDIIKTMSGKTVEVLNTDAEGRLVLADALTYAKRYKPAVVVDVATLTGASMVALGMLASGIMTKDDALADALLTAGDRSGDRGWRLPLWDDHDEMVKSAFADVANTQVGGKGRYGGATEGAAFLWQFAKELECPWAHIDMAPRITSIPSDELGKGAAGDPVRMLISFIRSWK